MAQGHEMAFFCYQYRGEARKEQGTNVVVKVYDMISRYRTLFQYKPHPMPSF